MTRTASWRFRPSLKRSVAIRTSVSSAGGKGSALRSWREGAEHFLPRGGFAPEPPPLSRHSRDPVTSEAAHQVMHAGTRLDEHDRLSHAAVQYARERVCLGVLPRGGERAQLPHPVPVPLGGGAGAGRKDQREERELQVLRSGRE